MLRWAQRKGAVLMTVWFRRWALGAGLILIAGCGPTQSIPTSAGAASAGTHEASQTPNGGVGVMPQALTTQDADLGSSWILPEAKAQDLIYYSIPSLSNPKLGRTYILSLPQGKLVGEIKANGGLCSDNSGNVWMSGYPYGNGKKLAEFAHGLVKPIKILRAPNIPAGCAIDPTLGNVATIIGDHDFVIYNSGGSQLQTVTYNKLYLGGLTYDGNGNLFILGEAVDGPKARLKIAELPKGATKIGILPGFNIGRLGHSGFEWDGKHLTEGDSLNEGGHEIFRYKLGRNRLKSRGWVEIGDSDFAYMADYWIQGSKVVVTATCGSGTCAAPIYLYNYPAGGNAIKAIGQGVVPSASGQVTISVAPK